MIFTGNFRPEFKKYLNKPTCEPLFFCEDSLQVLQELPAESIDFCMTNPPYWGQRQYEGGGIGLEKSPQDY